MFRIGFNLKDGFIKNFFETFFARGLIIFFDFMLNVLIVRSAGAEGRGAYSLFVTTIVVLALFAGCGLQYSNIYIVGKRREELKNIFSNSVIFNLLIGIILFTAYAVFQEKINILLGERSILKYGFYTFISLPFLLIFLNNVSILLGLQEIRQYNAVQVLNSGLRLALIVMAMMALNVGRINAIILGWVIATFLAAAVSGLAIFRRVKIAFFKLSLFIESIKVGFSKIKLYLYASSRKILTCPKGLYIIHLLKVNEYSLKVNKNVTRQFS